MSALGRVQVGCGEGASSRLRCGAGACALWDVGDISGWTGLNPGCVETGEAGGESSLAWLLLCRVGWDSFSRDAGCMLLSF